MNYIALSATQLSRFGHHWFWGLCVNHKKGRSLYNDALALQQNSTLRRTIAANVDGFNQLPWFIRSLCWLVNYRQYRFHYYQLQGYWSWQLYQKGVTMFSKPNQLSSFTEGFMVTASSLFANNALPDKIRISLKWFSSKVRFLMNNKNLTTLRETPFAIDSTHEADSSQVIASSSLPPSDPVTLSNSESIPSFIVQETMLPTLTTLGIVAQVDECIALSRLKSAYNLSRLQTHPDKAGSESHSAFLTITKAYETLIILIQEQASPVELQANFSIFDALERIRQEISILREENIQMQARIEQGDIKLKKIAEEIMRQNERERKQQIREKELQVSEKELQVREKELQVREKELQVREKEQQELDIQLTNETKQLIITLNKQYHFPELTEEMLLAYCNDTQSFIKKIEDLKRAEDAHNTVAFFQTPAQAPLPSCPNNVMTPKPTETSITPNNTVVFFPQPVQDPFASKDKVKVSCGCLI